MKLGLGLSPVSPLQGHGGIWDLPLQEQELKEQRGSMAAVAAITHPCNHLDMHWAAKGLSLAQKSQYLE